jgi:anti-sigma-K factor RskA
MTDRPDIHTLTGAYAVDALPDDEREVFEQHLVVCDACAQEVLELQATAARLSDAAFEPPPPSLRDRVLAEIDATRQDPPLPSSSRDRAGEDGPPAPPLAATGADRDDLAVAQQGTTGTDAPLAAAPAGDDELEVRRSRRSRVLTGVLGVAAALLAAAVGALAVTVGSLNAQLDDVSLQLADANDRLVDTNQQLLATAERLAAVEGGPGMQVAELLSAGDVVTVAADGEGGVLGRLVASPDRGEAVFVAAGWDRAPHAHTYELWVIDPAVGPVPAGTFDVDGAGGTLQPVTGDLRGAAAVAVTIEPEGGSPEPTTDPILVLELPEG